ncbi:MAG: hypothetical protein JWN29_2361 [Acidimicrobiales bacterium]|nr:hypothetical protein [Acidimicrobiales bacterium]
MSLLLLVLFVRFGRFGHTDRVTGGFDDPELADDLVGVASARLLAADVPRAERLDALRLLGVLATVADAQKRVRRPLRELAREFDLPADEVEAWLAHLLDVEVVRWEGGMLELAALEPPAAGGLRLHDFLALASDPDPRPRRRSVPLRPAGLLLAAAAIVALVLLGPAVVRDRSTPVSADHQVASEVPTTKGTVGRPPATHTTVPPASAAPGAIQQGPVPTPSTSIGALPCPTGSPILQVLRVTPRAGKLVVEGQVRNPASEGVVLRSFTLRAAIGGGEVTAPGTTHELLVPRLSTVPWEAELPVAVPLGTTVGVTLGDWDWRDSALSSVCPSS